MPDVIVPNLWFDTQAEEAAQFYVSLFPGSRVTGVQRYGEGGPGEPGTAMTVQLEVLGQPWTLLNGGPQYRFNEAVSFMIPCETQDEVDRYWEALTADGGEEGRCGWCKDRFGVSWQVVPTRLGEVLGDPDPERSQRAVQAMLGMSKLDLDALRRAADG